MNLKYLKVSLFEISKKKKNFFTIFTFFGMYLYVVTKSWLPVNASELFL